MRIFSCTVIFSVLIFSVSAYAAPQKSVPASLSKKSDIAAVVGEQAITSHDVDSRIAFIIATTKLTNTPEVTMRIRPQVIRTLVDERLQLLEAKNNEIIIADGDIGPAITSIEEARGMEPGAIFAQLDAAGVSRETFAEQIRAQLAWNKLMLKVVRPNVKISDEDITLAQQRLLGSGKKQELQIAVLTIPIDKPQREAELKKLADKLVSEVRAGANFEELSRQFSSASLDRFWVRPQQLDPNLAKALGDLQPGAITSPARTEQGFTLVKLYATRALAEEMGAGEATLSDEDRSRIQAMLFSQRMELEGQKYLRTLRREAFVEIR